jgi:hypothetical protein
MASWATAKREREPDHEEVLCNYGGGAGGQSSRCSDGSAGALPKGFEHASSAKKIALPKEVRGLWCYSGSEENGRSSWVLPNDVGALREQTRDERCGDNTHSASHDWIVIDADGSYHGFEDGCRAVKAFVIDRGVTASRFGSTSSRAYTKEFLGTYAAYGVIAHCEGEGGTRNESTRIDVGRGGIITIGTVQY